MSARSNVVCANEACSTTVATSHRGSRFCARRRQGNPTREQQAEAVAAAGDKLVRDGMATWAPVTLAIEEARRERR